MKRQATTKITSMSNSFIPSSIPKLQGQENAIYIIFSNNNILVEENENNENNPFICNIEALKINPSLQHYLGFLDGKDLYCIEIEENVDLPERLQYKNFRSLLNILDNEVFQLAGRAYHILNWDKLNQFCGRCGSPTQLKTDERAKLCTKCNNLIFPKISPAIIVAILKGNELLLANAKNFPEGLYSLIAGFVEPGETLEECVIREVYEEVGIKVKNLKYFDSQPWPFPDSLMVGFIAEYESGIISVDGVEIVHADWFQIEEFPQTPSTGSIAGRIIKHLIESSRI